MWQAKDMEGFVELETDYARLLRCNDGKNWSSQIVIPETGDIWTSLKKAIPEFFAPKATLNFVCPANGGTVVLEFPSNSTDKDIEANLQINRRDLFDVTEDLCFKLTKGLVNQVTQKRDVTVSYATKSVIDNIKSLCAASSAKLGKITTLPDSLFGALRRQFGNLGNNVNICIQIGFSKVYIIIFRGAQIISVRTLLTGSLRELESVLFAGYSLVREEARAMISGHHPNPMPAILDTIKENRLDLITHLGGIFAELRTKKLLTTDSKVYLSYNVIDEPTLTQMIGDRFDIPVQIITGMESNENGEKYEDYPAAWLCGASDALVPNLIPPVKINIGNLIFNPVTTVIVAVAMSCIPYPIIQGKKAVLNNELEELRKKHAPIEQLLKDFKTEAERQTKLVALASQINSDIEKRGISSRIARHITENLPESTRLETLEVNYKEAKLKLVGYTVDPESALQYLDRIKECDELTKQEIVISDLESRRIKFTITALIGDGKGRK